MTLVLIKEPIIEFARRLTGRDVYR